VGIITVGFLAKLGLDWREMIAQQQRRPAETANPWDVS